MENGDKAGSEEGACILTGGEEEGGAHHWQRFGGTHVLHKVGVEAVSLSSSMKNTRGDPVTGDLPQSSIMTPMVGRDPMGRLFVRLSALRRPRGN